MFSSFALVLESPIRLDLFLVGLTVLSAGSSFQRAQCFF